MAWEKVKFTAYDHAINANDILYYDVIAKIRRENVDSGEIRASLLNAKDSIDHALSCLDNGRIS